MASNGASSPGLNAMQCKREGNDTKKATERATHSFLSGLNTPRTSHPTKPQPQLCYPTLPTDPDPDMGSRVSQAAWRLSGKPYTLAIIKPDVAGSVKVVARIMQMIHRAGFEIVAQDHITPSLSRDAARAFYQCHEGKFFFDRLVRMMSK